MYPFKSTPRSYQKSWFDKTSDHHSHAAFWDPGTGKTKFTLDTAGYLYLADEIDALLVVAPNGVHINWVSDELQAHLPDEIFKKTKTLVWNSRTARTQRQKMNMDELISHKGFSILTISYDAFITTTGKKAVWRFLQKRNVLYVLDESHNIKTPGAKRTKSIVSSGKYASYRRILTGTPSSTGPFDLYSQIRFLQDDFWHGIGCRNFHAFKTMFGVFRKGYNSKQKREYDQLVSYRNIGMLTDLLKDISSRVREDEVVDLPERSYVKRHFELTPQQRRIYEQLRKEFFITHDDGTFTDASLAMVRLLRFQQVTCGYLPSEDDEGGISLREIPGGNPRLEVALEELTSLPHPAIVWARFTRDIDNICSELKTRGFSYGRYDGAVSNEQCELAKHMFQKGEIQFFVSNPAKGAEGLTLNNGKTAMFYSNNFKLIDRLQAEKRNHRIGQTDHVRYVDIQAADTVDQHIIENLVKKLDIASQLTGDTLRSWL